MAGESETAIAKTYGVDRVTIARLQHRFHRTLKWDRAAMVQRDCHVNEVGRRRFLVIGEALGLRCMPTGAC